MKKLLFIALGGSMGALGRYGLARFVYRFTGVVFPWGTLTVNMLGCFIIGFCYDLFDRSLLSAEIKSMVTIGFLGAFTTFSTYSLETVNLFRDGEIRLGVGNMLISNILGIIAVVLGFITSRLILRAFK